MCVYISVFCGFFFTYSLVNLMEACLNDPFIFNETTGNVGYASTVCL